MGKNKGTEWYRPRDDNIALNPEQRCNREVEEIMKEGNEKYNQGG